MAYPFNQAPTFFEFKEKLNTDYGCEFIEGCRIHDGDGDPHDIWHFQRSVSGRLLTYVCENFDDSEIISFHLIRSICKNLEIPFQKDGLFGLDLG